MHPLFMCFNLVWLTTRCTMLPYPPSLCFYTALSAGRKFCLFGGNEALAEARSAKARRRQQRLRASVRRATTVSILVLSRGGFRKRYVLGSGSAGLFFAIVMIALVRKSEPAVANHGETDFGTWWRATMRPPVSQPLLRRFRCPAAPRCGVRIGCRGRQCGFAHSDGQPADCCGKVVVVDGRCAQPPRATLLLEADFDAACPGERARPWIVCSRLKCCPVVGTHSDPVRSAVVHMIEGLPPFAGAAFPVGTSQSARIQPRPGIPGCPVFCMAWT